MKKLLVLSLVLGMATMASAAFSLNAVDADVADGAVVSISVSETLGAFVGKQYAVVVGPGATLSIPSPVFVASLSNTVIGTVEGNATVINPADTTGWFGAVMSTNFAGGLAAGTTIFDGISVIGDGTSLTPYVTVFIYDIVEGVAFGEAVGSVDVAVSYIPEPMTMGLLGLGALFLRRRK